MREPVDEPDGVGHEKLAAIRQPHLSHQRIERDEERVGRDGLVTGQRVEERGLAGVRVTDQRDGWDR